MNIRLNGWQRIGLLITLGWVLYATTTASINYYKMRDLDKILWKITCPPIHNDFLYWHDKKSNKPILIQDPGVYRDCDISYDKLREVRDKIENKEIEPELRGFSSFFILLLLPIFTFWFCSYTIVLIAKWVIAGFKQE